MLSLPLTDTQKGTVKRKIGEARTGFARGLIHNLLHHAAIDKKLLVSLAKSDPTTYSTIASFPAVLIREKLSTRLFGARSPK